MKIIKCLADLIEEELHDASKYVELAIKWKDEKPETADVFYELSKEEMGHAAKLHERVTDLIEEQKEKTGEPPEGMMVLYNYLHEKHTATATEIKVKQGMYKMQE